MKKEELIQRYKNNYATDAHLDKAVTMGILTAEETQALKDERRGEGGIVTEEVLKEVEAILKGENE